jgi:bifunctional UDP-N-acetylglucosamine pyrophosphorylase/glucosamine-1-phosphate N-acetyltransferase
MKAIILAAGEGTRLRPITYNTPKPLIKIYDKSILEHNIQAIYKYVEEITIIVNYKKELIEKHIGNNYKGTKISYHTQ